MNLVITLKRDVLGYVRISGRCHIWLKHSRPSVSGFNGEMKSQTSDWVVCVSTTLAEWKDWGGWWWCLVIHVWIDVARGGSQAGTHGEMALVHISSSHQVRVGWWSHSGWEGAVCWVFLAAAKTRIELLCKCSDLQCGPARNLRRCKGVLLALLPCFITAVSSALRTCALSLLYHVAWKRRQSHTRVDPCFPENTMKADKTS